jgi:hypothetical protein
MYVCIDKYRESKVDRYVGRYKVDVLEDTSREVSSDR